MTCRVVPTITAGLACWPSISSRAGGARPAIWIGPAPVGQPVATGGVALAITAVCADDAKVLPSRFFAWTVKRTVLPTSAALRTYVAAVAERMFAQFAPSLSQRVQK